jgi:hypothetical protein
MVHPLTAGLREEPASMASDGMAIVEAGWARRERAKAVEQIAMSKRAREKARRMNASGEEKQKVTRAARIYKPPAGDLRNQR